MDASYVEGEDNDHSVIDDEVENMDEVEGNVSKEDDKRINDTYIEDGGDVEGEVHTENGAHKDIRGDALNVSEFDALRRGIPVIQHTAESPKGTKRGENRIALWDCENREGYL